MELYNALKKVVELQTEDILKDGKLINILGDFKAYEDMPSTKYLLKYMVSEGLMANLLYEYQSQNDVIELLNNHIKLLSNTYGYKESLAEYVVKCLAYALGWITELPSISNLNENSNIPNNAQVNLQPQIIDDGKHLLFKQFPITGDVNTFIQALSSSGYKLEEPYSYTYHAAALSGPFAGHNDCSVLVVGTPKTHQAYAVMVYLQEHHIWFTIKNEYEQIKSQLTKKYGKPESFEYFSDPYYEGDGSELTALYSDHCTWRSYFKTSNGTISVSMTNNYKVLIAYQDKLNQEIRDQEDNAIANDDL